MKLYIPSVMSCRRVTISKQYIVQPIWHYTISVDEEPDGLQYSLKRRRRRNQWRKLKETGYTNFKVVFLRFPPHQYIEGLVHVLQQKQDASQSPPPTHPPAHLSSLHYILHILLILVCV